MRGLLFLLEVNRGFGWNLIRSLFSTLDTVIFWLFGGIMKLLYDIAGIMTADGANFSGLYNSIYYRVYMIVAIYMLFKVTFSILTYIINPETMTDKSQGAGKLVTRIIISLIMLIIFPKVAEGMMTLQGHIIQDGTIDNIISGRTGASYNMETKGKVISATIYNGTFISRDGAIITKADGVNEDLCYFENDGKEVCIPSVGELQNHVNDENPNASEKYKFDYVPLAATAVGVIITVLALSMCIDIATRTFKIIILFAIAPIPIVSYIDPKSEKDGAFSKWTKLLLSTYLELFIRLAVISLIVLLIGQITSGNTFGDQRGLVKIALIIALLFFAKEAPKFICDAIGIKMPEGGAFSGIGKIAAAGALGLGAIGTGVANFRSHWGADKQSYIDSWDKSKTGFKGFLSNMRNEGAVLRHNLNNGHALSHGVTAGLGSIFAGGAAAIGAKDNYRKAVMDARNRHLANTLAGNTGMYRGRKAMSNLLLGSDDGAAMKKKISAYNSAFNTYKDLKSTAAEKMADSATFRRTISANGFQFNNANFKEIEQLVNRYSNGDSTADTEMYTRFGYSAEDVSTNLNDIKDQFTSAYIADAFAGGGDGTTRGKIEYALDAAGDMEFNLDLSDPGHALENLSRAMGDASQKERDIKTSNAYKRLSGQ